AAANAYLSTQAKPGTLSRALDWTQYSARLALVTAPVLLGLATQTGLTRELYQYLAVLPCVALAITAMLPRDLPQVAPMSGLATPEAASLSPDNGRHAVGLLVIQFLFCFAMVVTFPYFLLYSDHLGVSGDGMAGWFYAMPHLVYLVVMPWMRRRRATGALLPWGLGVFSLACVGQAMLDGHGWLPVLRVVFGFGMLLSFMGLNRALAAQACAATAGRLFGRFDACGKWAGALGGITAGWLVANYGLATPFVAASASAGLGTLVAVALFVLHGSRSNDDVSTSYA
ncbi:MAG: MFS transporter, partial [Rhodanobacter sp.]